MFYASLIISSTFLKTHLRHLVNVSTGQQHPPITLSMDYPHTASQMYGAWQASNSSEDVLPQSIHIITYCHMPTHQKVQTPISQFHQQTPVPQSGQPTFDDIQSTDASSPPCVAAMGVLASEAGLAT
jgi:hypothetical protein